MLIYDVQWLTLLDYPGKVACTVFTPACNFNCPYCHNSELASTQCFEDIDHFVAEDSFFEKLETKKEVLDGVVITGGEPTLQLGIDQFCKRVHDLGFLVKLDTNGSQPQIVEHLVKKRLVDYVAMDVKGSKGLYNIIAGLPSVNIETTIKETIGFLMDHAEEYGVDYEFRTTVVYEFHDRDEIRAIGDMIRGAKKWYLQPFGDSPGVKYSGLHAPSANKMKKYLDIANSYVDGRAEIRG